MPSILALSFYAAYYPPRTGGELRLYYIYYYLSKYYKIDLITFIDPTRENNIKIIEYNKNFREFRVPRSRFNLYTQKFLTKFSDIKEWSAFLVSVDSKFNKKFKDLVNDKLIQSDTIIFVSPFLYTLGTEIYTKNIVYESYNLEYELMKPFFSKSFLGKQMLKYLFRMEGSLCKNSDIIFAVSEEDRLKLSKFYNIDIHKIYLSPNGVNPNDYNIPKNVRKGIIRNPLLLFVGSYHPPNFEAVQNIVNLSGKIPHAYFIVAGGVALYYITYFRNDLELADVSASLCPYRNQVADVYLINGFYSVEDWNSIPTRWSKPDFKMSIGNNIDSIEIKLFSPQVQLLKVTSGDIFTPFNLKKGWNVIRIHNGKKQKHLISFTCEKPFSDPRGVLGVAVQSLTYYDGNNKSYVDLTIPFWEAFTFKNAKNVLLLGQICDEDKKELYRISDISLNPMVSGSGTNIKMLDYMAAGLPVITTPIGARGLGLKNYIHALICDIPEFPRKIHEVLCDNELYAKLSRNGRKIVEENYNWVQIAEGMARNISEMEFKK